MEFVVAQKNPLAYSVNFATLNIPASHLVC